MKRLSKHKLGFSLVEMVLVLAIICLLGGIIGGLCIAISNSFITTINLDDSSDYALLFARGFENSFLANSQKQGPSGNCVWYVDSSTSKASYPTLRVVTPTAPSGKTDRDNAVFEPEFLGENGTYKWDILMYYKWDSASERVLYCVLLKDRKNGSDFTYFYEGGFWVPRFTDRKATNGSSCNIIVSGEEMKGNTISAHGFGTNQIPGALLDGSYKSMIEYTY